MKLYELLLVLNIDTTLGELSDLISDIEEYIGYLITSNDLNISKKNKLAYKVDGQTEAVQVCCKLLLTELQVRDLDKMLDHNKSVMQHLIRGGYYE